MKLKGIWKRFIAWITFNKTSNHHSVDAGNGTDKHYSLDTSPSQEHQTERKRADKSEMHDFIERKKNRTPFYKDDNKKTWE